MATFRQALENAARSSLCLLAESSAGLYSIMADLVAPFPPERWLQTQAYLVRQICNSEPPANPGDRPPLTGGQCSAWYRYRYETRPVGGVWRSGSSPGTNAWMPIQGAAFGAVQNFYMRETSREAGSTDAKIITSFFVCRGVSLNWNSDSSQPSSNPINQPIIERPSNAYGVSKSTRFMEIRNWVFFRISGSDNCGNPPPSFPPPTTPDATIFNPTITYTNSNNVTVTIPIGLAFFKAFLNLDGTISIPFTVNVTPTISFPATFNFGNNSVTFDFRPTNTPSPPPTSPTAPPPGGSRDRPDSFDFDIIPPPPPSGDEFADDPPPPNPSQERIIRAVTVTASSQLPSQLGIIFQPGGNPDLIIPDIGFVQFKIRVGQSSFWTQHQKVNNIRAFIPCEWEGGAIDVQGTPRPGVSWQLTPVYAATDLEP